MFCWYETLDSTCKIKLYDIQRYQVLNVPVEICDSTILCQVSSANTQDATLKFKGNNYLKGGMWVYVRVLCFISS